MVFSVQGGNLPQSLSFFCPFYERRDLQLSDSRRPSCDMTYLPQQDPILWGFPQACTTSDRPYSTWLLEVFPSPSVLDRSKIPLSSPAPIALISHWPFHIKRHHSHSRISYRVNVPVYESSIPRLRHFSTVIIAITTPYSRFAFSA